MNPLSWVFSWGSEVLFWNWVGFVNVWSGSPLDDFVCRMAYPLVSVEFLP